LGRSDKWEARCATGLTWRLLRVAQGGCPGGVSRSDPRSEAGTEPGATRGGSGRRRSNPQTAVNAKCRARRDSCSGQGSKALCAERSAGKAGRRVSEYGAIRRPSPSVKCRAQRNLRAAWGGNSRPRSNPRAAGNAKYRTRSTTWTVRSLGSAGQGAVLGPVLAQDRAQRAGHGPNPRLAKSVKCRERSTT